VILHPFSGHLHVTFRITGSFFGLNALYVSSAAHSLHDSIFVAKLFRFINMIFE